ncbi:MAG: hypothetical protein ACLU37_03205 [Collinsella sp.]
MCSGYCALVAYGAIIIWSASQFKADARFRHLLGIGIGRCWRCWSGAPTCVAFPISRRRCSSSTHRDLLAKIPGLSYTGGLG